MKHMKMGGAGWALLGALSTPVARRRKTAGKVVDENYARLLVDEAILRNPDQARFWDTRAAIHQSHGPTGRR